MKQKSEQNRAAAKILKSNENQYYAASVHCAYYSCFQLSKHILCSEYGLDYAQQDDEIHRLQSSSHNYIIAKLRKELNTISCVKGSMFDRNIEELKALRKEADYTDHTINEEFAQKALDKAQYITELLQKEYHII